MNTVIFGLILISGIFILVSVIKYLAKYKKDKALPLTASDVIVVAKRYKTREFGGDRDHTRSFMNSHFITFQFKATDERQEFRVLERDFGLIAEGDEGTLWHQGDIFSRFDRN